MAVIDRREPDADRDKPRPARPSGRRKLLIAAELLTAAWVVPILATALHVAWLMVPVLLVGTASLLRVGRTLLDRLVIAAALLAGLLIVAGMLFSFWPWHLRPIAVAGLADTVLVVACLWHKSAPQLPIRIRATDAIILAGPVVAWLLLRRPVHGKTFANALPYLAPDHDFSNHYSLFDAIHRIGGYPFVRPGPAAPYLGEMTQYPPGAHYLYVVLDVFRRSTTDPGGSTGELVRYTQYETLGFCLLTLAVPWAARWIAGPSVTGWRRVLITATASAFCVFGQLSSLFWQSFDGEVLGLAFVAVTVALMIRPPGSVSEQIVLAAVLLTAVAYVYSLFLVNVGIAALVALCSRRAVRARGKPRDLMIRLGAAALVLSAVPLLAGLKLHPIGGLFTAAGAFVDLSRWLSITLVAVALAAVLTRTGRRSPVWRATAVTVGAAYASATAVELYGRIRAGSPQYYSSKLVESSWVVALCGIGALGLLLPKLKVSDRAAPALAALSAALPVGLVIGFPLPSSTFTWSRGHIKPIWTDAFIAYSRAGGTFGDGVPTVFTFGTSSQSYVMTMISTVINHDLGRIDLEVFDPDRIVPPQPTALAHRVDHAFQDLNRLPPNTADRPLAATAQTALDAVETYVRASPPGLRVVVVNTEFAALLRRFAAREPDHRLSVLYLPGVSPGTAPPGRA